MLARQLIFGLVAAGLVLAYAALGSRLYAAVGPTAATTPRPTPPRVEIAAPRVQGTLSFVMQGDIFVMRGGALKHLTDEGRNYQPALSADGGTVVFSRRGQIDGLRTLLTGEIANAQLNFADIVSKPAGGGAETILVPGLRQRDPRGFHRVAWAFSPALSPDGRRLAYIDDTGAGSDLVILDLATKRSTVLSRGTLLADVSWSPDGKSIVTTSYANTTPALLIWNAERPGTPRRLANLPPGDPYRASYSPDGRWLVYTLRLGTRNDVQAFELATGRNIALTSDGRSWNGVFSPEGDWVAYLNERDGVIDLHALPLGDALAGGTTRPAVKLTAAQGVDGASRPAWSR